MKNTILFTTLILALVACNNLENSRTEILTLSSEYDGTIEKVREVNQKLAGELEMYSMYQSRISEARDSSDAFGMVGEPEPTGELAALQREFSDMGGKFSALMQEINNTTGELSAQKPQLDTMIMALNGNIEFEGKVGKTMKNMRASLAQVNEKVKPWDAKVKALGDEIKTKYEVIAQKQGIPMQ